MKRLTALALLTALNAAAQVTPSEPFGGRPFGAPPGTPPPAQQQPAPQPQGAAPMVVPQTQVVVQPPAGQVAVTVPAPAPAPLANMPPRQPMVPGSSPQALPPPQPVAVPAPVPPPPPVQPPAPVTPPFAGAPGAGNRPPAAAAPAAPSGTPVKGLPADAPQLVISGSVYSPNRSQRILIVNGQPVREGAEVGGVVVQQVLREGAVLGYRGASYNVFF